MNTYHTSQGDKVKRSTIDRNIRKAKQMKLNQFYDKYGYYFCEDCQRNDCKPIDCSHDVSVKECLETGRSELAWSVDNITLRGRPCHKIYDKS